MNHNTCYNCGGELCKRDGRLVCVYCGSYMPENISSEEVMLLTSACQKLRLADFFDAELEFEDIIRRHPKNAQGYWGHLLAKYGIKYEEDYDGSRIPTCYAASIESIYDSSDYQKVLEYADEENRAVFIEHAAYIERVRREWVEKASKEPPYDIFISYKDSDRERGIKRTQDSVTMQDLYLQLKDRGYRVFFSHESLRNKTGEKYEPYIYGALSTAKIMLVYGSRPDYINATWVKNEWTRYKKRMQAGEKKQGSLLVAYEGFAPMELPSALSSLQCLDAGEKRFYTDLFSAIERILQEDSAEEEPHSQKSVSEDDLCSHELMTIPAKAPTCTEDGRTESSVCILCGKMMKRAQILPATGHSFGAWHVVKKATCVEDGEHESVCKCGERKTKKIPSRGGHILGDWETIQAPVPGKDGLRVKKCLVCGTRIEQEKLPALPGEKKAPPAAPAIRDNVSSVSVGTTLNSRNLKYKENTDGKTCKITGIGACHDVDLVIPETIGDYRVTGIAGYAFLGKEALTSVTIPKSVTTIGMYAFRGCTNLMTVYYRGTKAEWERMKPSENWWGDSAIAEICCNGANFKEEKLPEAKMDSPVAIATSVAVSTPAVRDSEAYVSIRTPLTSQGLKYKDNMDGKTCKITGIGACLGDHIVVPETIAGYRVTGIAGYAFLGKKHLESITIPKSVVSIGMFAFRGCTNLKLVYYRGTKAEWEQMKPSENWWGDSAIAEICCIGNSFQALPSLATKQEKELPHPLQYQVNADGKTCKISGVSTLKDKNIEIPSKIGSYQVRDICAYAFWNLKQIESIVIPMQITYIGDYAFKGCKNLKTIHYKGTKKEWKQILLDKDWRSDSSIKRIECTDGAIKFLF